MPQSLVTEAAGSPERPSARGRRWPHELDPALPTRQAPHSSGGHARPRHTNLPLAGRAGKDMNYGSKDMNILSYFI